MQSLFTILIMLQFAAIVSHDLLHIPGWTHGRQVREVLGRRKLWLATAINAIFPGLAVALALLFWHRPRPGYVSNYWILYCAVTVLSAITMWYIPYFFGASENLKRDYARMYEGTRHILPPRGDNPRPNLLHLCFHGLFIATLAIAVAIRFQAA
jgi:hypothetical protein